jgi:hypothetical protein
VAKNLLGLPFAFCLLPFALRRSRAVILTRDQRWGQFLEVPVQVL